MKAEEILDKIETQLEQALDCYNKASVGGSDPDLDKKKYHAQQLLGMVRALRAEDQQIPHASRFKQVSEIAMDVEIEAAKERNERLRKEIREQTNANRCKEERKIKFRGFNAKNNQWLYGSHIINRGKHFVAPDEFADDKTWEDYEVEPETVGQFTGLFDKNGKEVYEGDIIEWTETHYHAIGAVAWREQIGIKGTEAAYNVGWCVEEYKGKVTYIIAPSAIPYGVVVGNVYDNFEQLKGGQQ